ncbi:Uncharacterized ABC transporter ATP-binding protein YbhF [Cardiobacterium hominis]|uniref:ATP-binding cassette domain-containing protein n=1 Tax=Cardiobacterium hominis TaxID=2718 RepID=UPI000F6CEE26|nr:ATP-binding cassette domain-containing protein [Cardiobacterium hominis]VEG76413.1 Uncharacterized ABC transporter ATP-binding protein YbhF [Cardiobacterium hominis]
MTALTISHLTHRYGKTLALDDLSLTLPRGLTVGLIGPDGVGKSTLLALIAGVRRIQSGELHVLGGDMRKPADRQALSHRIAYMPQGLGRNLYPTLSVYENIDFHARLFGLPARERRARIARLLEATGLAPFPDRATGKLSGGMKQKASLCCALVHAPDLLILDEPTTGVDPLSRRQFWALVADLQRETAGMTVLVATAYIEEAEPFAQLWAMDAGKLLVNAPTREVMAGHANLEDAYIRLLPPEKQQGTGGLDLTPFVADPSLPPAIEAHGLTKRFGDFTSVDNVSFTIQQGEIFGFLGSNGCGKSTTMKMLTGLLQATSGTAELLGAPVDAGSVATRMRVGYMSQAFSLYEELTVRQNLALHARLYRLGARSKAAIRDALTQFDLADVADVKPSALPLGIRQRLQLAAACLHRPEVLILDEPTSGVDPAARDMFWRHLLRMSREDKITIFVTTHFMNEAARCDRISFMHQGRVLAVGTPAELVAQYQAPNLEEAFVQYLLLDEAAQKEKAGKMATTAPSPAVLPPLPVGEGWGGGSVRTSSADVETSAATTANEPPTAAQSPAVLPPLPVGEGWGGGSKKSSVASFMSAETASTTEEGLGGGSEHAPTTNAGLHSDTESAPPQAVNPSLPPPRPSPTGGGGFTVEESASAEAAATLPPPQPSPTGGGGLTVEEGTSDSTISDNEPPTIIASDTPTAAQSSTDLPPPQPSPAADASASCEGGGYTATESATANEPPAIIADDTPTAAQSPTVLPPPSQRSAAGEGWGGGSVRTSSADVETSSATTANEPPTAAQSPTVLPPPSQRSAAGEGWGGSSVRISSADVETSSATTANEPPTAAPSPAELPPPPVGEGGGGGSKQSSAASFQSLRGWLATIRTFAIREGKELLRDHVRTFFALFGPVILMTAVTWGVSFDVGNLAFAVRDRDQSAESRAITEYFSGSPHFRELPPLAADADIDTALESSAAKMIIDIPPSFGRDLLRGARPEIGFYLDGAESFNASNLTGYIASILGDYARDQAHAHGIRLPPDAAQLVPRFRYNPDFKSILAIAPGVLMLALSLFPAMMAAVGVVREREIGSIANFYASPASRLQFLLGKQLPYLAAAMTSFLILYLMMRYWFGVPLNGSAAALLTGTLLMCATTTATGLLVSCFTRSQVAAIFITAVGTVMPAMSFSGFLVPVSSLQGGAYIMGKILPSAWYANLTTGTFVKGLGYPDLVREHFILGGYYLIILTLAVLNLKKQER